MIAQLLTLHFLQSILDVAKGIVSESNFCIVCEVLCTMQRRVLIMLKVNIRFPPFLMEATIFHFHLPDSFYQISHLCDSTSTTSVLHSLNFVFLEML